MALSLNDVTPPGRIAYIIGGRVGLLKIRGLPFGHKLNACLWRYENPACKRRNGGTAEAVSERQTWTSYSAIVQIVLLSTAENYLSQTNDNRFRTTHGLESQPEPLSAYSRTLKWHTFISKNVPISSRSRRSARRVRRPKTMPNHTTVVRLQ
jgi:hypothetical protein